MCHQIPARAAELAERVLAEPWLVGALQAVARCTLPDAWIGAGVVRDVVWGQRCGGFRIDSVNDIDVVYLDPDNLTPQRDHDAERELAGLGEYPWEAKNQAAVHLWYHHKFGGAPVPAFRSIHEAVATWPEFATSVAIRLAPNGLEVCAPHGLGDLLDGVWRRNPTRVSLEYSRTRLARQNVARRWPGVTVR
jgi:uncharacterized protein